MSDLRALIFDVDGTLADTERNGHRVAFNAVFTAAGLDWHWTPDLYGELLAVTGGKERIQSYIDRYHPGFRPATGEALRDFIAGLHRAKTGYYTGLVEAGEVPLRSGVRRLLEEGREQGLRLAVATTTSIENVTALLTHCLAPDAASWFEVIAAGDVVPAKKPAPDIYHYALRALNLPAAACLAFEDSGNGLRSARGAGLPTIVTVSDYSREEDFTGAALVVDQLGEPDAPMSVLAGDACGARWLDMAALRRVHARCLGAGHRS